MDADGKVMDTQREQQPAIRVVMMPRDTNPMGTIFGGLIVLTKGSVVAPFIYTLF